MLKLENDIEGMIKVYWRDEFIDIVGGPSWTTEEVDTVLKRLHEECEELEKHGIKPTYRQIHDIFNPYLCEIRDRAC
jgi:hypothetical protein